MLVAGTLFLWNAGAHADAESDRQRLLREPAPDTVRVGDAAAFEAALAHERALAENGANFRAVRRMDTVIGVTAAIGVGLVVASVVLHLSSPRRASALTTIRPATLRLSF